MNPIDLDLLSGKVLKSIELVEIYSGKSMIITFDDGTILEIGSINDGGVYAFAQTPITEE